MTSPDIPAIKIYAASAGSGKTSTLVTEYLSILFRHAANGQYHTFRNIMAITFTNKATEEMKQRIIESLKEITAGKSTHIRDEILKIIPDPKELSQTAERILRNILQGFSDLHIQTIDSFFQDIIRSFARELQLPLNFEIELDTKTALEYAVDKLIGQVGQDPHVTKWLNEFVFSLMQEDKGWDVSGHLLHIGGELFQSNVTTREVRESGSRIPEVRQLLEKQGRQIVRSMKENASFLLEEIESCDIPLSALCNRTFVPNLKKLAAADKGSVSLSPTFLKKLTGEKPYFTKKGEKEYSAAFAQLESGSFAKVMRRIRQDYELHLAVRQAYLNMYALGVIHLLNEHLRQYRSENNVLFLSDAASLISQYVGTGDMPFLFEKIGNHIEYFFIDEFQDTSQTQWDNMVPLLMNLLGSAAGDTRVMLVGDAKQSIYRWRGGRYQLIAGEAAADLAPFSSETIPLLHNWRSLPEIVEFNNRFFTAIQGVVQGFGGPSIASAFEQAYRSLHQVAKEQSLQGRVSIDVIPSKKGADWKQEALESMDKTMAELLQAGYRYRDMAVLVRKKPDGIAISEHLQSKGIDVHSMETLLLKTDASVKLLEAGLRFVDSPQLSIHYVNLVWQHSRYHKLRHPEPEDIFPDHDRRELLDQWQSGLKDELISLRGSACLDILDRVAAMLKVDLEENLFAAQFRQLVYEHLRTKGPDLGEFLEFWQMERDNAAIPASPGEEKVQVLTIHKSKGLEFPVVLIPFCEWDFYEKMHEDLLWLSNTAIAEGLKLPYKAVKDLEQSIFSEEYLAERTLRWIDNINLLYVAFTRARDVLAISCPETRALKGLPAKPSALIRAVSDDWGLDYASGTLLLSGSISSNEIPEKETPAPGTTVLHRSGFSMGRDQQVLRKHHETRETRIGHLVHDTLYHWNAGSPETAMRKAMSGKDYSEEEADAAGHHLQAVRKCTRLQDWLSTASQYWKEQDLWHKGEQLRIDLLIRLQDRCIVIDYKTGGERSEYETRVRTYAAAVEAIFKIPVEAYLLYTDSGQIEQLA